MSSLRHNAFIVMLALVRSTVAQQGWCPAPPPPPTPCTVVPVITGRCSGNTASSNDFSCPSGQHLKSNSASITGSTAGACCDADITGRCSGNTASSSNVACGANKIYKSNSASITGTTVAACCDDACSGFTCPSGQHSKTNAATIMGNAAGTCCDADITGRCSGNTVSSSDVACGANKLLKSSSASITGTTVAACCDDACSTFSGSCPTGQHLNTNAASVRGTTAGACCVNDVTNLCSGNTQSSDNVVCGTACTHANGCMATANLAASTTKTAAANVCLSCCSPTAAVGNVNLATQEGALSSIAFAGMLFCLTGFY